MNAPEIDFKYCKKCGHLKRMTSKRIYNCIMEFFTCDKTQNTFVYPGIKKHHVQVPRHCQYYAELCVSKWNE